MNSPRPRVIQVRNDGLSQTSGESEIDKLVGSEKNITNEGRSYIINIELLDIYNVARLPSAVR